MRIPTKVLIKLKRRVGWAEKRKVEFLALLLLIPLFQSGFDSAPSAKESVRAAHIASVPSVREEGGRLHIEPPEDGRLTMRVLRVRAGRQPTAQRETSKSTQETYAVIVSAP